MPSKMKYVHNTIDHNMRASNIVVPILLEKLNENFEISSLNSVVDVGCGLGTWLKQFENLGFEILGIDGPHLNKELLVIDSSKVQIRDLEEECKFQRRFDIGISLEVAEHISEKSAKRFINNLTNLSDVIVFGAAIPYQGGQNHVNEQWPSYWINIFNDFNYTVYDLIRPDLVRNTKVDWWYRQNMFVAVKINVKKKEGAILPCPNRFDSLITKELWDLKMDYIQSIEDGRMSFLYYAKRVFNKLFLK